MNMKKKQTATEDPAKVRNNSLVQNRRLNSCVHGCCLHAFTYTVAFMILLVIRNKAYLGKLHVRVMECLFY